MDGGDEVAPVVDYYVRAGFQNLPDAASVFFRGGPVNRKYLESFMDQGSRHVVLGGQGVAPGYVHVGTAGGEDFAKVCGLGLQMDGKGYLEALERLCLPEIPFQSLQQGHMAAHPLNL